MIKHEEFEELISMIRDLSILTMMNSDLHNDVSSRYIRNQSLSKKINLISKMSLSKSSELMLHLENVIYKNKIDIELDTVSYDIIDDSKRIIESDPNQKCLADYFKLPDVELKYGKDKTKYEKLLSSIKEIIDSDKKLFYEQ